jgi:hypothetical protein
MYYRNAQAAVVVYDITKAVRACCRSLRETNDDLSDLTSRSGIAGEGQSMGQRAPTPGIPKHRHRTCRQQGARTHLVD